MIRTLLLVALLVACGDNAQPAPDAGAAVASHPGEHPPTACAPGWRPTAGGCELDVDAGSP